MREKRSAEFFRRRSEHKDLFSPEEVKQYAFRDVNCPEDLDSSYFKETQVNKKARDLMAHSKAAEALDVIICEYDTGIPSNSFLIRKLMNEVVTILFKQTEDIDYVVKALKIDPGNEKMKEFLMR